jgi:nicotinate dehydrogenase subunit A
MAEVLTLHVDGQKHTVTVDPGKPLLYTLRDELGLNNPRFGCGLAQCGACTVQLNGRPVRSCVLPTSAAKDAQITTIAGLGTPEKPHPLQTAYIEEQVPQCGYCTNGFLMTAAALLRMNRRPTDGEIRQALAGLKCRCGTHLAILRAVKRAAASMNSAT